jgi:hypothetical protein
MASQIANNSSTTTLVQPSNSLPNSGDSTTSTSLLPVSTTTTTTTTIPLTVEIANGSTKAIASAMSKDATGKAVIYLNGKKTEATVTREQDNITVTVAGTRTQLRATAPDGTSINITGDGVLVVKHGSHVSTATTGFAAYSSVESWCYSTPTKLGTEQSDEAGATTGRYLITDKIPSGKHHLVIRGTNSTGQSLTIGFAMRVTEDSLIVRFATSPFVWLILIVALLIALFIPGRIRHKEDSIQ